MPPKPSNLETDRRTKKTLHVVAGFYVAVGLIVTAVAAVTANPLAAFLGFLMISVALAAAIGLGVLFQLGTQLTEAADTLNDIRSMLEPQSDREERTRAREASLENQSAAMINLATLGGGERDALVAATLDGSTFPRLVAGANGDGPIPSGTQVEQIADLRREAGHLEGAQPPAAVDVEAAEGLMREWSVALLDGDLAACRSLFSTLRVNASADVPRLERELQDLTRRIEASLKKEFADNVRTGDYAAALSVGGRIRELFPGRRVADDFQRIEPLLRRRLARPPDETGPLTELGAISKPRARARSVEAS